MHTATSMVSAIAHVPITVIIKTLVIAVTFGLASSRLGKNGGTDRNYLARLRSLPRCRSRFGKNGGTDHNHLLGVCSQPLVALPNVGKYLIQLAPLGRGWA